ncbi:MAG: hypothetical protein J0H62_03095, partial [Rhizobiales bacterium]|nr:hypothetical protein [Hyphomicrobiales bacterium]
MAGKNPLRKLRGPRAAAKFVRIGQKRKRRGWAPPLVLSLVRRRDQNSRSTAWSAWAESERAVVE